MNTHPRIVQVLCGPLRHCLVALAYEPGITTSHAVTSDIILTAENAGQYVRALVDELIEAKRVRPDGQGINPVCGICGSPRAQWVFEDAPLAFENLAAAMPALRANESAIAVSVGMLGLKQKARWN